MLKTITFRGRQYKLGRRMPTTHFPKLFKSIHARSLPTPPESADFSQKALKSLHMILGNDQEGDCTEAGKFHVLGVLLQNANQPFPFTTADVIKDYSRDCGYVPGDPSTDQGGDCKTVLANWQSHGLVVAPQHKIEGFIPLDPTDINAVKVAASTFENAYIGFAMPDAFVNEQMPQADGFVWKVAGEPNPANGHCIAVLGYDAKGLKVATWGMIGTLDWASVAKYLVASAGGELYAVVSRDMLDAADIDSNGRWSNIVQIFDAEGGNIPVPVNPPSPPAPPVTPPVVPSGIQVTLPAIAAGAYTLMPLPNPTNNLGGMGFSG